MSSLNDIPSEQLDLLSRHLELVLDANEVINLTRIDSFEEGMLLHVEDSLFALEEVKESPAGRYGDLGTGGGFPGIPLAVATGRETLLIDSRLKKMQVLQSIVEELGIASSVSTYAGRAELLALHEPESFSILTARALSKLSVLLELASPLLKRSGRLVCYKAHVDDEEIDHALDIEKQTGMKFVSKREGFLSDSETFRSVFVFEKVGRPSVKLPRQEGFAQKRPL